LIHIKRAPAHARARVRARAGSKQLAERSEPTCPVKRGAHQSPLILTVHRKSVSLHRKVPRTELFGHNFGWYLPALGRADDDDMDTQPDRSSP
jgi:hypothetical protein